MSKRILRCLQMDIIDLAKKEPHCEEVWIAKRIYFWHTKGFHIKDISKMEGISAAKIKVLISALKPPQIKYKPYSPNKISTIKWVIANKQIYKLKINQQIKQIERKVRANFINSLVISKRLMVW